MEPTVPHDEIARYAYRLYEDEGRPDGRDVEHWLRAERDLNVNFAKPEFAVGEREAMSS